jgi:hypothetical protein
MLETSREDEMANKIVLKDFKIINQLKSRHHSDNHLCFASSAASVFNYYVKTRGRLRGRIELDGNPPRSRERIITMEQKINAVQAAIAAYGYFEEVGRSSTAEVSLDMTTGGDCIGVAKAMHFFAQDRLGCPTDSAIRRQLEAGKPIMLRVGKQRSFHVVVLMGVNFTTNKVLVADPWGGRLIICQSPNHPEGKQRRYQLGGRIAGYTNLRVFDHVLTQPPTGHYTHEIVYAPHARRFETIPLRVLTAHEELMVELQSRFE